MVARLVSACALALLLASSVADADYTSPPASTGPSVPVQAQTLTLGGYERQGLTAASPASQIVERRVVDLTGISGWTTIATLTPSTTSGAYFYSDVNATLFGLTNGQGQGLRKASWYYGLNPGVDAGSISDTTLSPAAQGTPPQFRMTATGGAYQIQVASSNATAAIVSGFARLEIMLPAAAYATVNWTITP